MQSQSEHVCAALSCVCVCVCERHPTVLHEYTKLIKFIINLLPYFPPLPFAVAAATAAAVVCLLLLQLCSWCWQNEVEHTQQMHSYAVNVLTLATSFDDGQRWRAKESLFSLVSLQADLQQNKILGKCNVNILNILLTINRRFYDNNSVLTSATTLCISSINKVFLKLH